MSDALSRLRKLVEAATPGPFDIERRDDEDGDINWILHGPDDFAWFIEELDSRAKQNALLVQAALRALPLLLDLIEEADNLANMTDAHTRRHYDIARSELESQCS